jgi:twitching motility protein PilT
MAKLDALLARLAPDAGTSLLLLPGQPPQLKSAEGARPAAQTALAAAQIEALLTEVAPEGSAPAAGAGSRWRFDYRLGGTVYAIAAVGTPEGWVASINALPGGAAGAERAGEAADQEPDLGPAPGTSPAPLPPLRELLDLLVSLGGSDLHLCSAQVPRLRLHGELRPVTRYRPPSAEELTARLREIVPERNLREFEEVQDTDFAHEIETARFRANVFRDRHGPGCVLRQIPRDIPRFESLGLPDSLRDLALLPKGLVLVTGPTGSGKSTTLAAILDLVNRERPDHLITIEDPIEFVHASKRCLVNQREVGVHTGSFTHALRAALREDPDVVLVGELRDLETIATAIATAETGHLVFGTLHTTTAASTVDRMIDQFPGDRQEQIRVMLSESLRAVIAQTLLRRIGGGRVAAFEILRCTPAVANLIREGKTFQIPSAMQIGRAQGMLTLTESLFELVRSKAVEPEEALRKATDREALMKKLVEAGMVRGRGGAVGVDGVGRGVG